MKQHENIVSSKLRLDITEKLNHKETVLSPSSSIGEDVFVRKILQSVNSDEGQRFATTHTKVGTSEYYTHICIEQWFSRSCVNVQRVKKHTNTVYAVNSEVILRHFREAITSAGEQLSTDVRKMIKVDVDEIITILNGPFSDDIGQIRQQLNDIISDLQKIDSDIEFVKSKQGRLHRLLTEDQASCGHHTGIYIIIIAKCLAAIATVITCMRDCVAIKQYITLY